MYSHIYLHDEKYPYAFVRKYSVLILLEYMGEIILSKHMFFGPTLKFYLIYVSSNTFFGIVLCNNDHWISLINLLLRKIFSVMFAK